ncbi:F-box protein At5g07610-like [Silene latifolia]|uniref:F-box protein At5g07610-like n=1 Tax=Silene latifolia TaxID=37657 RepID=UPI003D775205
MFHQNNDNSAEFNSTNSGEIIGHNDGILSEILLPLTTKQLTGFKLVAKQWRSLISDHHFLSRYTLRHPPSLSGLFLVPQHQNENDENLIEYIPLQKSHSLATAIHFLNFRSIKIIQSCNGLLLTCHGQKLYVFNPTTGKSQLIPNCPNQVLNKNLEIPFSPYSSTYYSLAFDPKKSIHYKIICIEKSEDKCRIATYSSNIKLWRLSKTREFSAPRDVDFSKAIYCNGVIHWTRRTPRGVYFEIEKELINQIPEIPRKEQYSCEYFGQSKGRLYSVFTMEGLHYYELFEMERDYSTWVFKCWIDLDELAFKFPKMGRGISYQNALFKYPCHVLSVVHSRNGKIPKVIMSIPGEIIAYNSVAYLGFRSWGCRKLITKRCHV